jgi:lauroyl/myristoyl acyltransferase
LIAVRAVRVLFDTLDVLARTGTSVLPSRANAGFRAQRALQSMRPLRMMATRELAAQILLSQWRCGLLLRYLRRLPASDLKEFLQSLVSREGAPPWEVLSSAGRPVVLVTPHYGACVVGCLAAAQWLEGLRPLSIYYELRRQNSGIEAMLSRIAPRAELLNADFAGSLNALRTLRRGGCVALMPDMYLDVSATVAVPFLGCWMRVPTGAAFMALKSDALLLPAYVIPERRMHVTVRFSSPIDSRSVRSGDSVQDRFILTCLLFADIERAIRRAPEHWLQWELLPRIARPLSLPESLSSAELWAVLKEKCRTFPALLRRVPELEMTQRAMSDVSRRFA